MNPAKRLKLVKELENKELSLDERRKLEYKLSKMDHKTDWDLRLLFGGFILALLIATMILFQM